MPYRDPIKQRAYQREYQRLRRAGSRQTPNQSPIPSSFRLQTARDVIRLIEEQVNLVRLDVDADTLEKARAVGYLAGVALRAIEAGDLSARIESLEYVLKTRSKG